MIRSTTLIAAALLAGSAFAGEPVATITSQEGTVLVNTGEQFATAADNQALQAGDRVMVMEGAQAIITFTDGCALPLAAGTLAEIPAQSTCTGAVAKTSKVGPTVAQAVGDDNRRYVATNKSTGMTYVVFGAAALAMLVEVQGDNFSIEPDPAASP